MVSIFLARVFLSFIFLAAAFEKIFYWNIAERNLLSALCDWQAYAGHLHTMQECMASLMPWSSVLLVLAIVLELFGSLMVLFGYKEKIGASLLILLLIPATFIFHPFWFMEGHAHEIQTAMFFKNLAILGGLMLITLHGAKTKADDSGYSIGM
jgi:putative oxidoreductase